jgi:hypothetical protein
MSETVSFKYKSVYFDNSLYFFIFIKFYSNYNVINLITV